MSAIVVDGKLVHYEAIGRGRPVVFIHGWIGSWRYWMVAMDDLSERYRAYALDLWGFGETDRRQDGYSLDTYMELVERFLDELGLQRVALVGHGLGGVIALRLAASLPERVDRVAAVCTPLVGTAIASPLATFTNHHNGDWVARILGRRQASAYPEVSIEAAKADLRAVVGGVQTLLREDLRPVVENLTVPVLLLYGKNDSLVYPPDERWLRQLEENVYYFYLEESAHFPMLDEANRFTRLLRQFLALGTALETLELRDEWRRRVR